MTPDDQAETLAEARAQPGTATPPDDDIDWIRDDRATHPFCVSEWDDTCSVCGSPAAHKVGEEITLPFHNLTNYLCCRHFKAAVGDCGRFPYEWAIEQQRLARQMFASPAQPEATADRDAGDHEGGELMGLVEFLSARLAEREAMAREAAERHPPPWRRGPMWRWHYRDIVDANGADVIDAEGTFICMEDVVAQFLLAHDPARVLAEVAAWRRVIELAKGVGIIAGVAFDDEIFRTIASVYRDHPDYDPAWAPEEAS